MHASFVVQFFIAIDYQFIEPSWLGVNSTLFCWCHCSPAYLISIYTWISTSLRGMQNGYIYARPGWANAEVVEKIFMATWDIEFAGMALVKPISFLLLIFKSSLNPFYVHLTMLVGCHIYSDFTPNADGVCHLTHAAICLLIALKCMP